MRGKILFLLPYPLHQAPSQRFRVEAYFQLLRESNVQFDVDCFLDDDAWSILYKGGSTVQKALAVVKGFVARMQTVFFRAGRYDYIFIHREAAPLGPPVFEWLLSKCFRKRIIYDFDDAIWIPNVSVSNRVARFAKCFWKVKLICKWSYRVSVGNNYLAAFASQCNHHIVVNPTCVDTHSRYIVQASNENRPSVIGWTGSHSTLQFLALIVPALQQLEKQISFRLLVICDQRPEFDLKCMDFIPWQEETEIEDLSQIDVGIMPLREDAWSEGKCGFKLIQYMALGVPAIASPVGVNKKIIEHGCDGYLCNTKEEWVERLSELLQDVKKRIEFGKRGREKIEREYSIESNAGNFLSLFLK